MFFGLVLNFPYLSKETIIEQLFPGTIQYVSS